MAETVIVSDRQIARLLAEEKGPLSEKVFSPRTRKAGHRESSAEIAGADGSKFVVKVRRSIEDPGSFSIILCWKQPGTTRLFRLMRCNGDNHRHKNKIEGSVFKNAFHVHIATQRYQELGAREEEFAELAEYSDFTGAVETFKRLANIISDDPAPLFYQAADS